jgi:hypothetical protein
MPKLARWYSELGPQGLIMIGAHAQKASDAEIRSVVQSKGAQYTIVENASVKGASDFRSIPHCLLFDYTGKCIYRGSPDGAESLLLKAVQEAPPVILEGKKLTKLGSLNSSLRRESSLATALHQAKEKTTSKDAATAEEASYVVEKITTYVQKLLDTAKEKKDTAPGIAWSLYNRVANNFKGTEMGKEAADTIAELKKDKEFQAELKVWPMLEKLKALEGQLTMPEGTSDTKSPAYRNANSATLSRMLDLAKQMKKAAPNAKATQEALQIAENYGLKAS